MCLGGLRGLDGTKKENGTCVFSIEDIRTHDDFQVEARARGPVSSETQLEQAEQIPADHSRSVAT